MADIRKIGYAKVLFVPVTDTSVSDKSVSVSASGVNALMRAFHMAIYHGELRHFARNKSPDP